MKKLKEPGLSSRMTLAVLTLPFYSYVLCFICIDMVSDWLERDCIAKYKTK